MDIDNQQYPPVKHVLERENLSGDNLEFQEYVDLLKQKFLKNNQVLLIQTPQLNLDSFNPEIARNKGYIAYPPYGLQCLASILLEQSLDVKILDLNYEILCRINEEDTFNCSEWLLLLEECLHYYNPSVIGITCMFDIAIDSFLKILGYIKCMNRHIVITGGMVPTYDWEKLLNAELSHFVFEGESENKFKYFFDKLYGVNSDTDTDTIPTPGIYFKHNDKLKGTQGAPDIVKQKGNLISAHKLIPIEKYCQYASVNPFSRIAGLRTPFATIQLNRGCRAKCTFCAVRDFMGKGVRTRNVEEVLEEIAYLYNKRSIRHFEFLDDDLLMYKKPLYNLLRGIQDRKLDITWSANNGLIARSLDVETLDAIRDSGCIGFKIGIESGNPEMLKTIKKPTTLNIIRKSCKLLQKYPEMFVGGNFIIGVPNESFKQLLETFWFANEINLDWISFSVCQTLRGASAFEGFEEYFDERLKSGSKVVRSVNPARDNSLGEVITNENVLQGMNVFKLSHEIIPDKEQVLEIWFTFNIIVNYINNKNLIPEGQPGKFISWLSNVQVTFTKNPYMSLFLAMANILVGNKSDSKKYYNQMLDNLDRSDYWRERFHQFGLSSIVNNFPENENQVLNNLEELRLQIFNRIQEHINNTKISL